MGRSGEDRKMNVAKKRKPYKKKAPEARRYYLNFTVDYDTLNKFSDVSLNRSRLVSTILRHVPESWLQAYENDPNWFIETLKARHFRPLGDS